MAKEKTPLLLVTVGLPRSGKSTWARKWIKVMTATALVCPDDIRLAMHGQAFARGAEELVWAITRLMVKALFRSGHQTVILDGTFNTKERRDLWTNFYPWDALGPKVMTKFMYFPADPEECIARAERDERPDLVQVILRMADEHEPPDDTEYHEVLAPGHLLGQAKESVDANTSRTEDCGTAAESAG